MKIDFPADADCTLTRILDEMRGYCCQIRWYAPDENCQDILYRTKDIILEGTFVDEHGEHGIEYHELDENDEPTGGLQRMLYSKFDCIQPEEAHLYVY